MRNAAAAVAAADNWRNVLREPLERISLVFTRPSSTRQSFPVILLLSAATRAAGLFHPAYAPLQHRVDGGFKSQLQDGRAGERPPVFFDGGNEKFDGEDRIDFLKPSL